MAARPASVMVFRAMHRVHRPSMTVVAAVVIAIPIVSSGISVSVAAAIYHRATIVAAAMVTAGVPVVGIRAAFDDAA
ncbi:hypothetical protein CCGE525_08570 [Rhizobium jaguaris]|uniref:Uncharacterized protein n=1 Tax=Rhizobium jaguaris TaxID=1312183 RepID=A0A387FV95_9HYPH|nr:hypothetical protein CCGE525_08570 [Rhizobium jaguaris]